MHVLNPVLPGKSGRLTWSGLYGASRGLALAEAAAGADALLVIVLEDQHQLEILETEIRYFLNDESAPVQVFPGWECLPYDNFSPHQDITSARMRLLGRLPRMSRGIVLLRMADLVQKLPPTDYVLGHTFSVSAGQKVDLEALREQLANANYLSVDQVLAPGEFAVRGGLIDVFPMGSQTPYRLDLFDDELESIREFDPDSQRSGGTVDSVSVLPASEFPMTDEGVARFRSAFRRRFEGDPRRHVVYTGVSAGTAPPGCEFFFPLFFDRTSTFFDYLGEHAVFVLEENFGEFPPVYQAEIQDRYANANLDPSRRVLPPGDLYLTPDELGERLDGHAAVIISHAARDAAPGAAHWRAPAGIPGEYPVNPKQEFPYQLLTRHVAESENRVLFVAETPGRREALDGVLRAGGVAAVETSGFHAFMRGDYPVGLTVAQLERGLVLAHPAVEIICEPQLYGERVYQRRRRGAVGQDPESIIKSLAELNVGDPVVHLEHGVGRYAGLEVMDIDGRSTELLCVEYQDNDKLYIPVLDLDLISRFIGGAPELAPLHKLGGDQWEKSRKKAREKAYDVAVELLETEALRSTRQGARFTVGAEELEKFRGQFPFEETPDQQQVIDAVLADLESDKPMDRLVCGDVGFGKTEVALRAAFVVALNGGQVAILTPTTLLARQHYQTFRDRFADWPVNIATLTRLNTRKDSEETVRKMKSGQVDIVIGAHRLLQQDIEFSRLGLLIIDEEHRFGVRQKERLKSLRGEVDILTLTATPIPRTLNMTMSGLRAISIIASPPVNRLSIKTFVRPWHPGLAREACIREIRRGGQVFYLHNDVRTIERAARDLGELVPEAEIDVAHGQMSELRLERVMQDFYHQRFNVLVCSTIIESGIDIPSANTIIINRADKFGLAQLHQLRGRVGRSHHQAFAYLMIPDWDVITADARKRLDAITSMEDLGAGFALASHDLEIRGAGELLGETQSGLIDDIGFSLYSEYLGMAVDAIRRGEIPERAPEPPLPTSVELHLPALFPESYLANPHTRLILYKRISAATSLEELEELQVEVVDRFGLIPEQGKNLFQLSGFRVLGRRLGITRIDVGSRGGVLEFVEKPDLDPTVILELVEESPDTLRLGPGSLLLSADLEEPAERIEAVRSLLRRLARAVPAQ